MISTGLLIIDDEPALLGLLRRYLARLGYDVETCNGSAEALASFQADPDRFAIIITDLSLPGMSGEELIAKMRELRPQLRAIISSGYYYEPLAEAVRFLQKPFLPQALAEAIEKARS